MNILFAASEAVPFVKTGGLADVIGALPKELRRQGAEVRLVLPKYADIPWPLQEQMQTIAVLNIPVGWRNQYCGVQALELDGTLVYFLDNEYYFRRHGLYGYGDDAERYAFYCRAVLEALPHLGFQPDVIHCHDWQTGLIPVFLKALYGGQPGYDGIKTVFTIHNLKYQGVFPSDVLKDIFGLHGYYEWRNLEYYGGVNCMKGGLLYSDRITTVSRTYAGEIQTPYYGEGMDGLLRQRQHDLHGIVNGIDYELYDPMQDEALAVPFRSSLAKKRSNKTALQDMISLPRDENVPMLALITRLVHQKGLDLIAAVLPEILDLGVQLVVLGTGEGRFESLFREAAARYPQQVSAHITFNDDLARKIYAASDLFLMPSQFEPCGIGQLLAMRYLSVPIVRETGGLKDTVMPYNEYTEEGWGFSFANYNAHDMLFTIGRAVYFYREGKHWESLINNMRQLDYSWVASAKAYLDLYREVCGKA